MRRRADALRKHSREQYYEFVINRALLSNCWVLLCTWNWQMQRHDQISNTHAQTHTHSHTRTNPPRHTAHRCERPRQKRSHRKHRCSVARRKLLIVKMIWNNVHYILPEGLKCSYYYNVVSVRSCCSCASQLRTCN